LLVRGFLGKYVLIFWHVKLLPKNITIKNPLRVDERKHSSAASCLEKVLHITPILIMV
jgi:hypothetical protein